MTDRSKTRIYPHIELDMIRDLSTGEWYKLQSLVPTPTDLFLVKDNTLDSQVGDVITSFSQALSNVAPIAPEQDLGGNSYVPFAGGGQFRLSYIRNDSKRFRYTVSGKISSPVGGVSNKISVRLVDTVGGVFTGTTKVYPAGVNTGGGSVSEVGFTFVGYGRAQVGSEVFLEVAKDFTGILVVEESLISIEEIN